MFLQNIYDKHFLMISYFFIFVLINLLFFSNYKFISKVLNVYDFPDSIRKKHQKPTPLLGGSLLIVVIVNYFLFEIFFFNNLIFFTSKIEILIFIFLSFLFFITGFLDDKFEINPNLKLILFSIFICILMALDKDLILMKVNFTFRENFYDLGYYGYFFTILCFLLFINSFNMIDGINGQAGFYSIFLLIILNLNNTNFVFFSSLILSLILFLIFNFKNKMFLGDSGTLLVGFMVSYFFIKSYNLNNNFFSDEIVLIMLIPGLELLRLAITRIIEKKHPFKPDEKHIHHLFIKNTNYLNSFLSIQILFILPYLLYLILNNSLISLILSVIIYSSVIYFLKKKI